MGKYKIKKICRDCCFPDGLWELKDIESKWFIIIENKDDIEKIKSYLDNKDKENAILKKALELACEEIDRNQGSLSDVAFDYFIEQAKERICNDKRS